MPSGGGVDRHDILLKCSLKISRLSSTFLQDPEILAEWQQFGDIETLLSYGLRPSFNPCASERSKLAKALARALPLAHPTIAATVEGYPSGVAISISLTRVSDQAFLSPDRRRKTCSGFAMAFFRIHSQNWFAPSSSWLSRRVGNLGR